MFMILPSKEELLKELQQLKEENKSLSDLYTNEVAERKRVEEVLKDSNEFNTSILKMIPFGIGVIDESGNTLFQNETLKSYTGTSRSGIRCWELPNERNTPCEICPLLIGIGIGKTFTCEMHHIFNNNIFEITHVGLLFKGQKSTLEIFRNITLQKKAEEKLLKLSLAVEHSPASIVITNLDGEIEYVNSKFTEVTGYIPEEAIGKNPRILKSGIQPVQLYEDLWKTITRGHEWRGEFQNKKKNGEFYWEFASISPIKNTAGEVTHFIAVKEDISDRKMAESIIQQKTDELIELNATKDKFFSILAHDLRNPFNAILGYTEMLVTKIEKLDIEKTRLIAENIQRTTKQTYKLLENLLEWSRIQRGLLVPEFQKCNLNRLMDDCIMQLHEMALNKNIEIVNQLDSTTYANCDEQMTHTVIRNLLSNAIKFTPGNAVITLSSRKYNSMIEIQVTDHGLGIAQDKLPFLFRIDKNISTKGTANEKGSGLGLVLCKELIEKQDGTIWVKSEVGKGSSFYFTLTSC